MNLSVFIGVATSEYVDAFCHDIEQNTDKSLSSKFEKTFDRLVGETITSATKSVQTWAAKVRNVQDMPLRT